MSSIRLTRSFLANTRSYVTSSTPAGTKQSNLPLYLGGAGILGLGTCLYLGCGPQLASSPRPVQMKSPLEPDRFVDFRLKKVLPYNHNTAKFIFELPENQASLLPVASCVLVKSSDPEVLKDAKGKAIIRPYTPVSPSNLEGELILLVKRYENGNASRYIHSLTPGDTLAFKGPISKWPYQSNEFEEVALIGGGSGITPLYQLVNHALTDKANTTKFKLLFSNVTEKDILLREELDALKKKYPRNFDVVYLVDAPSKEWTGPKGFINVDIVKEHVASPTLGAKVKIFVCGPPGQVAAIAGYKAGMKQGELGGILKELGYTEEQVYKF